MKESPCDSIRYFLAAIFNASASKMGGSIFGGGSGFGGGSLGSGCDHRSGNGPQPPTPEKNQKKNAHRNGQKIIKNTAGFHSQSKSLRDFQQATPPKKAELGLIGYYHPIPHVFRSVCLLLFNPNVRCCLAFLILRAVCTH